MVHPLIPAVGTMAVVPIVASALFSWFGVPAPADFFKVKQGEYLWYIAPVPSLQEALERNYHAVHTTMEGIRVFHQAMATVVYITAFKDVVISIL